ncbi:hypothetical protein D9Q81_08495 [Candidatus Korarchaeum cryptofilum]|uniref:Uncharacterized protein n=1 Tax=Candidatus Korarchaeum cryptofilum TaxID=498846 RepID=A0A429G121_9CREN|nr:hypothetical protein D9Q81_08495 [Candidatus Korarchaeum cryptofilum]
MSQWLRGESIGEILAKLNDPQEDSPEEIVDAVRANPRRAQGREDLWRYWRGSLELKSIQYSLFIEGFRKALEDDMDHMICYLYSPLR